MGFRIAYLCGTKAWGGLEMNQVRNAVWMGDRGHSVTLFCLKDAPIYSAALEKKISIFIIRQHRHHYDFLNAFRLHKALKVLKIQHLIFRATFDMSIAASIGFLSRGKIKTHYFMEMALNNSKRHFFRTWRYSFFDSWVCTLPYLKEQVEKNTKFSAHKIQIIPSGIDLNEFYPLDKVSSREKLGLPINHNIIGLIGRIEDKKGQMLALKALQYTETDFLLLFVGEETRDSKSNYRKELEIYMKEQDLGGRVQFLNFKQNPSLVFSALDWTLMASDSETFGMVTLESIACGTPVIGSNAGGTISLLKNGELGILFETKNPQDLAEKINTALLGNKKFCKKELINFAKEFDYNLVCEKIGRLIIR